MILRFLPVRHSWLQVQLMIALFSGLAGIAQSDEMTLVVPNAYENAEAVGAAGWPMRVRAQYIYRADQFAVLPGGGGYLTSLRWRPDGDTFYAADWEADEVTIAASVTGIAPGAMSDTFADNITSGAVTIVRATAPWQGGTENRDADGQPGGPKAFDIEFVLDTPFHYNPAEGNLLLDIVGQGPEMAPVMIDRLANNDRSEAAVIVAWNWDVGSPIPDVASNYVGGMAAQMTFVPLPGDYNEDCVVNELDFETWRATFASTVVSYAGADGNGNGIVDAADYTVWRDHYGGSIANGGVPIPIPEPAGLALVMMAVALQCARRRADAKRSCLCSRNCASSD